METIEHKRQRLYRRRGQLIRAGGVVAAPTAKAGWTKREAVAEIRRDRAYRGPGRGVQPGDAVEYHPASCTCELCISARAKFAPVMFVC